MNYIREAAEARRATTGRRAYGYITAGIIILLMLTVVLWQMPLWLFFAIVAVSVVIDIILVRKWINDDLLNGSKVQP